jgi:hypothetical protein
MARWNKSIWMMLILIIPNIACAQDTEQRHELGGLINIL